MFLGALFALCLITVLVSGGRLTALAELELRGNVLIALAIGTQILIISIIPGGSETIHNVIHLGTYALTAVYAWLNRRVPGVAIAAAGGACNVIAIAANGGVMPASPEALRTAGLVSDGSGFENSVGLADANLAWLGDTFAVPASWPIHNVFSVGDVLLVLGILVGLHIVSGSRPARALGLHPVTVTGVETFATGTSKVLVRVSTLPDRGMRPGDLIVGGERMEPLPGSGVVAGYGVPETALASGELALAMPNGSVQLIHEHSARTQISPLRSGTLLPITNHPS